MKQLLNRWGLAVVLILSIPTILPLFHPGFFPMHDDTQVARVFEMGKALKDGMFPVRWVADLGYGYGYPIFNFYAPLPYYIGGFLTLIGVDALLSTKIVFGFGVLLSGVTMYWFVRSFLGTVPALVASILYVYFPYHAVNIYVRGALSEFYAYAFLPLVFLGLFKIHNVGNEKKSFVVTIPWIILTAVSVAFVIISHNLSAYMLFFFLGFYVVSSLVISQPKRILLLAYGLAFITTVLLSAFYSFPAITEMKYTNVFSQVGGGADFRDHFVCLSQLVNSPWGFGGSTPSCFDGMSFKLGKPFILLFVLSLGMFGVLLIKRAKHHFVFFSIVSFLFTLLAVFMVLPLSVLVWDFLPRAEFLQYPWRFLNFVGLFGSVAIALFLSFSEKFVKQTFILSLGVLCIGLIVVLNMKLFVPQYYLPRDASFYTNTEYIRWTVSKISDEYLPYEFSKPQKNSDVSLVGTEIIYGNGSIVSRFEKTDLIQATVQANSPLTVRVNLAYFPFWNFYVDGHESEFSILRTGVYIHVPPGTHTIKAVYQSTQIQVLSNLLSIFGAVLIGLLYAQYLKHTSQKSHKKKHA